MELKGIIIICGLVPTQNTTHKTKRFMNERVGIEMKNKRCL